MATLPCSSGVCGAKRGPQEEGSLSMGQHAIGSRPVLGKLSHMGRSGPPRKVSQRTQACTGAVWAQLAPDPSGFYI